MLGRVFLVYGGLKWGVGVSSLGWGKGVSLKNGGAKVGVAR